MVESIDSLPASRKTRGSSEGSRNGVVKGMRSASMLPVYRESRVFRRKRRW
jgi:hypothetical protein